MIFNHVAVHGAILPKEEKKKRDFTDLLDMATINRE